MKYYNISESTLEKVLEVLDSDYFSFDYDKKMLQIKESLKNEMNSNAIQEEIFKTIEDKLDKIKQLLKKDMAKENFHFIA